MGGCGFIGTNLALKLHEEGAKVRILDDFSNAPSINISTLQSKGIEILNCSVLEAKNVLEAVKDQEITYNMITSPISDDGFVNAELLTVSNKSEELRSKSIKYIIENRKKIKNITFLKQNTDILFDIISEILITL